MSARVERLVVILILLASVALRVWIASVSAPTDDAYITFRYAKNLAAGVGFVYNTGERVLGTTTPLFALLLSPFALIHLPLETAARGIAVLADIGVLLLLYRLVRAHLGQEAGLLSAAVFGLFYLGVGACGHGMETQLFTLFLTAAVASAIEGRRLEAGAAAALSALTRPEGFLLAVGLGLAWILGAWRRRERFPWGGAATFLGLIVPWLLFATLYFGNPVPNSVLAKFGQQDVAFARWGVFFFARNPLVILLWLGAAAGAAVGIAHAPRVAAPLAVWAISYPLFFLLGRPPFLGVWYFPPVIPALAGLFAIGVSWTAERLISRSSLRVALIAAALCVAVGAGLPRNLETARWSRTLSEQVYRPMAAWVSERTGPGDLVQVSDIGYVGYFTGRRILDSSALVSPEVADFYARHRDDPAREVRYVLIREPKLVILPVNGTVVERFVAGGLTGRYRPAARFNSSGMTEVVDPPRTTGSGTRFDRFEAEFIAFERIGSPE